MSLRARLLEFAETRASLATLVRWLGAEKVSRHGGWLYTLGSLSALLFAVQLLTGLLLAVWYAPTPDHAHASVLAIETRVPGGSLVRGLHHWGASAMVIAVLLHLLRTFWFGAYRKPREVNWLAGVGLLLLVLGFGFTGYLLPWDQKAYWATVVGTTVPASLPGFGPLVARLMTGGTGVGAWTLTRFYALHAMLLPLLTLGLVAVHVALMRLHGHAGSPSRPEPKEPFYPYQSARDAAVFAAAAGALLAMAWRFPAPLDAVANPADASYVPRPEWYFLPLFELLKLFKGPLEPIGTGLLPGLLLLALALVPWLDRSADRRPSSRKLVLGAGLAIAAGLGLLLAIGLTDLPPGGRPVRIGSNGRPPDPAILSGAGSFERRGCGSCHGAGGTGGAPGKGLVTLAGRSFAPDLAVLTGHVHEKSVGPPSDDDDPDADIPTMLSYVSALREGPIDLSSLPAPLRMGGSIIAREDCRKCHAIYGKGSARGPALSGLAARRDRAWLIEQFREPKRHMPTSKMPSFRHLPDAELAGMADYLLALP